MRIRQSLMAGACVLGLTMAACSTGKSDSSSGGTSGSGASTKGGLPQVAEPKEAVAQALGTLKGKKVRMVVLGTGIALIDNWVNGLKLMFDQVGIDFQVKEANFDAPKLIVAFENYINEKPDLLIAHNVDVSGLSKLMKRAQDEGIYVIAVNLNSNQQTDAFVGPDFGASGKLIADRIVTDCKAKGLTEVAVINAFGNDSQGLILVPAAKAIFEANGLKVVFDQLGLADVNKAQELTTTALQQHPNLCAVVGVWDVMTAGASAAVQQAGKGDQVGVYTVDSSQGTCDLILKGQMTAAVSQGQGAMGSIIAGISEYLLQSGNKPGAVRTAVFLPQRIIDKSNAATGCYTSTPN